MFARRRHDVPGLNTTSTADISFMLLIFFLVTTNMDVDKGLTRQLPPPEKQEQQESLVQKGTLLTLTITRDNALLIDGQRQPVDKVCTLAEDFVRRVGRKHLIKIEASPEADYDTYFHLQNQLVKAYAHLRDETARRTFGKPYDRLSEAQRDRVKEAVPQRIAEDYGVAGTSEMNNGPTATIGADNAQTAAAMDKNGSAAGRKEDRQ